MNRSPIAKLPAELRNRIYEYTVHYATPIVIEWFESTKTFRFTANDWNVFPLALAGTCKRIRAECIQLFYTGNSFELIFRRHPRRCHGERKDQLNRLLNLIGPANEAVLSSLAVRLEQMWCSTLRLNLRKVVGQALSVAKCRPALPLKVKVRLEYACRSMHASKELVLMLDVRALQASCSAALLEVEARLAVEASPRARKELGDVSLALKSMISEGRL